MSDKTKFTEYRQLAHEVTEKFNRVSQGIREIEEIMNSSGNKNLADLIRRLQQEEKNKLELVKLVCYLNKYIFKETITNTCNGGEGYFSICIYIFDMLYVDVPPFCVYFFDHLIISMIYF